jgi:hypothetical protein
MLSKRLTAHQLFEIIADREKTGRPNHPRN